MYDCNYCKHVTLTEAEQQGDRKHEDHVCTCYNTRVLHNTSTPWWHTTYLYPCEQCKQDSYKNFMPRNFVDLSEIVTARNLDGDTTAQDLLKLAQDTKKKLGIKESGPIYSYRDGTVGDYQIITSKLCSDVVQVRRHKKKRINKKWRKRYGFKNIPWKTAIVDEQSKIIIMHPDVYYSLLSKLHPPYCADNYAIPRIRDPYNEYDPRYAEPGVFKIVPEVTASCIYRDTGMRPVFIV